MFIFGSAIVDYTIYYNTILYILDCFLFDWITYSIDSLLLRFKVCFRCIQYCWSSEVFSWILQITEERLVVISLWQISTQCLDFKWKLHLHVWENTEIQSHLTMKCVTTICMTIYLVLNENRPSYNVAAYVFLCTYFLYFLFAYMITMVCCMSFSVKMRNTLAMQMYNKWRQHGSH